jgi:hypothetical protein
MQGPDTPSPKKNPWKKSSSKAKAKPDKGRDNERQFSRA